MAPALLIQLSPVCGGVIAGVLHVILGPDHLCTIVTLSACQGAEAFWFGVRWAGGHLAGMAFIGLTCGFLSWAHSSTNSAIDFEIYEHYAYYGVGFLLMFMGGYFIFYADKYFDEEWAPKQKSCACHAHPDEPIATGHHAGYGAGEDEAHHHHHLDDDSEKKPVYRPILNLREKGSMLVGFAQGIACPAGVVGMVFLKQYNPLQTIVFISMFFTVTTLAMGLLAMTYGILTRTYISSQVLGRTIYYASCSLSLTLGALWIYLNATHRLDSILGHDHEHHHHHHSHEHGHEHSHHGHQHGHVHLLQEDSRLKDLFLPAL